MQGVINAPTASNCPAVEAQGLGARRQRAAAYADAKDTLLKGMQEAAKKCGYQATGESQLVWHKPGYALIGLTDVLLTMDEEGTWNQIALSTTLEELQGQENFVMLSPCTLTGRAGQGHHILIETRVGSSTNPLGKQHQIIVYDSSRSQHISIHATAKNNLLADIGTAFLRLGREVTCEEPIVVLPYEFQTGPNDCGRFVIEYAEKRMLGRLVGNENQVQPPGPSLQRRRSFEEVMATRGDQDRPPPPGTSRTNPPENPQPKQPKTKPKGCCIVM